MAGGVCLAGIVDRLVAYWPFEGNAEDASGNGHHGTIFGDITFPDGLLGQAASLDGDDDHIIVGESTDFDFSTTPFTFSAWINLYLDGQTGSDHDCILSVGSADYQAISFARYTKGNWTHPAGLEGKAASCQSVDAAGWTCINTSQVVPDDLDWHHLALTRDGSTLKIYVDGLLDNSESLSEEIVLNNFEPKIGTHYSLLNDDYDFNGLLDDLRIYDRALTDAEIRTLYWQGAKAVTINIKPGSDPNSINTCSGGTTPVAIFSTP
jgi:hypothetical protein